MAKPTPGSSAPQRSCRLRATSRTRIGRLHLVSIPYDQRLQDLYLPSEFTSEEYPNLVAPGDRVRNRRRRHSPGSVQLA